MSKYRKFEILSVVERSGLPISQVLSKIDMSTTTYYRWKRKLGRCGLEGLQDKSSGHTHPWNMLLPEEREAVLKIALLYPEWSSREVALHISDTCGFTVSESTVFRLHKGEIVSPPVPQRAHEFSFRPSCSLSTSSVEV